MMEVATSKALVAGTQRALFIRSFLLAAAYGGLLWATTFFLHHTGMLALAPNDANLLSGDAGWYHTIATDGYNFEKNTTGFFPLFPLFWKMLGSSPLAAIFLNTVLFAAGFGLLLVICPQPMARQVLWLSVSGVWFAYIPYTEALFFLSTTVMLYGLHTGRRSMVWIGLFAASLTRATAVVLLPALLAMELMAAPKEAWQRQLWKFISWYALPALAGLLLFVVYQHQATGVWFAYFKTQTYNWGHALSWFRLPFSGMPGAERYQLWLSAVAVFVCLAALLFFIRAALSWLWKNSAAYLRLQVLPMAYLVMVFFTLLFFNPKWGGSGTNMFGAQRYAMASPFFFLFISRCLPTFRGKWQNYLFLVLGANAVWLCFGSFVHLQEMLFYNFCTLAIIGFVAAHTRRGQWVAGVVVAFGFAVQLLTMQQWLANLFVD